MKKCMIPFNGDYWGLMGIIGDLKCYSGLPETMPNADQCRSMRIKNLALISIDRHWDQCQNFDRHWALIEGVLVIGKDDRQLFH